ncbi:hypothetical protein HTY52_21605 [Cupriavidus taiwanensis]|uniref:hypothetical protein n=1 Tax=Cupriavidus taiwanensis TaxID=164546 RepID=UPI0015727D6D|nr:hypothetical protein [Cupriavidus taiwanensis]NSX16687.1 hypothetical protein [Cupriavidus taiwanensis]
MTFDPTHYTAIDAEAIAAYQAGPGRHPKYRLHTDIGPHPFDGDPCTARVLLLLSNPGHDETSTPADHAFERDGWPFSSLHPEATPGMRSWSLPKVRDLVAAFGAQRVSQRVALVQVHPWASAAFDDRLRLPSMAGQVELVRAAIERGAVVVIGRNARYWRAALGDMGDALPACRNARNPTLNAGNLPPGIYEALRAALLNDPVREGPGAEQYVTPEIITQQAARRGSQ